MSDIAELAASFFGVLLKEASEASSDSADLKDLKEKYGDARVFMTGELYEGRFRWWGMDRHKARIAVFENAALMIIEDNNLLNRAAKDGLRPFPFEQFRFKVKKKFLWGHLLCIEPRTSGGEKYIFRPRRVRPNGSDLRSAFRAPCA